MSSSEIRVTRETLGLTRGQLAAELAVQELEVRLWEEGTRRMPRRHAEKLWQLAMVARQNALATSGLPECPWVQSWQEKLPQLDSSRLLEQTRELDTHGKNCPTCEARRAFADQYLPLSDQPGPAWLRGAEYVLHRLPSMHSPTSDRSQTMGRTLITSILMGLFYAVGLSVIAMLVGAVALLIVLFGGDAGARELLTGLPLIILSYFVAGIIAGTGYGLLKPLRAHAVGWVLTGMLIAAVAYGTVGLTSVLAYIHLSLVDYQSAEDAWRSLPGFIGVTTVFGGFAGLYYWWKEGRAPTKKRTSEA